MCRAAKAVLTATVVLVSWAVVGLGCADDSTGDGGAGPTSTSSTTTSTTGTGGAATGGGGQGGQPLGGGGAGGGGGTGGAGGSENYQTSLAGCWLDASCHRALIVSHGGDWDALGPPFLSMAAFEQALAKGANGLEMDVRVTQDGVPVIAHSSPIEIYESWDCSGQHIEQKTAAEITQCHLGVSLTETIQRLDDVLDWAAGKLIVELDVKETGDLAASVATILARSAEDRSFILVSVDELTSTIPTITGWQSVHYMVRIGDPSQVAPMLALAATHNVFLFEMDRSYSGTNEAAVTDLLLNVIIPGGVKGFASSDTLLPTVQNHKDVFHQSFDVVLSYNCSNGVQAAQEINVERGYAP